MQTITRRFFPAPPEPSETLQKLEAWLLTPRAERHEVSVNVRSLGLPSYITTTENLSATGMRISSSQPLPVGIEIPITLELGQRELVLTGRFAWCVWQHEGGYRAGVEFRNLTHEESETLHYYLGR
ncbi:MAG: PilZ domain-containing protein [Vulcanimicrobiota bacterium]